MLTKRIIPCLDVKNGEVVKGIQFQNHTVVGGIVELAKKYSDAGADELVFYNITASVDPSASYYDWVEKIAAEINIPFCVAGGIRTVDQALAILNLGADKISINSPALENPAFIRELVDVVGSQAVVIGIDSFEENGEYYVRQYTGSVEKTLQTKRRTEDRIQEVQKRGAGEIVLNCMNHDGVRKGYDIKQLAQMRQICSVPLIASGGAGCMEDFADVFTLADVDGALAASVFHYNTIQISDLKKYLSEKGIAIRNN